MRPDRRSCDASARPTCYWQEREQTPGTTPEQEAKKAGENLPLTLIQIHFNKGMRGRFGSGAENDTDRSPLVGVLWRRRGGAREGR